MSTALITAENASRAGKYLTFQLGREEFGIPVLQVREIMGLQDVTTVPNTPHHVKGVINLRGRVIPVLCLRARFGLDQPEYSTRTCIIVVQVHTAGGETQMGVIVDSVSEVLTINGEEIEDTPDFGGGMATPYLRGMAKVKDKVKILLDIDRLLGSQELEGLMS
jgi:purine-binding chemotaxis protein CheW